MLFFNFHLNWYSKDLENYHINGNHQNDVDSDDRLDEDDLSYKNKFNLIYSKKQNKTLFRYQINKSEKYSESDLELDNGKFIN